MKRFIQFSFFLLAMSLLVVSCKNKPAGEAAKTTEATKKAATASASAKGFAIDSNKSKVYWVGSKPTGSHNGSINITEGKLSVDNGQLVSGKFVIDMNSITNLDLKPGEGKEDLEAHLKGTADEKADHFFNVSKYPKGSFIITKVEAISGNESATHNITGDLTLKGKTKSITFPASVNVAGDKVTAVTPSFKINRTEWGINFMSKSVFDDLKDKFINDDIALNIQLETM